MNAIKLAIFDVDGTLYNGNLGIELLKSQIQLGLFNKAVGKKITLAYQQYKNNQLSRDELLDIAYEQYAKGIRNQKKSIIIELAQKLWKKEQLSVFQFALKLISLLKKNKYIPIALSGSPIEIIEKAASYLGISDVWAATFEVKDGIYTGVLRYSPSKKKAEYVEEFARGKEVDWKNSFAIGDAKNDAPVLEMVGKAVVFEPHAELLEIAKKRDWSIVDRKTVLSAVKKLLSN